MTHLSPPAPEDSTVTRKTSKLSTDPASEVTVEANWYTQPFSRVCCCSCYQPKGQFVPMAGTGHSVSHSASPQIHAAGSL